MYPFPLRAERRNVPNVLGMMGIKERRGYKWIVPLNRQKEKLKKKKKKYRGRGERESNAEGRKEKNKKECEAGGQKTVSPQRLYRFSAVPTLSLIRHRAEQEILCLRYQALICYHQHHQNVHHHRIFNFSFSFNFN